MNYQFLIVVPGSIMNEDGQVTWCKDEQDLRKQEAEWRALGFSEVIVYENISENR